MLTDLQCKSPPAVGKSKLFDGHGLYLEILKSGARSWRWKYRIHGKEKRLTFGLYPDVSLKKARIAREQAAALLRTGVDPSIDRVLQAAQAAAQGEHTFKSVALTWHASQVPLFKPTHAKHVLRTLENDVFPSYETIADWAVCSRNAAIDAVKRLKGRGFVDWVRRSIRTNNDGEFAPQREQTSNAYYFDHRRSMAPRTWQRYMQILVAKLRRLGAVPAAVARGAPAAPREVQYAPLRAALASAASSFDNAST